MILKPAFLAQYIRQQQGKAYLNEEKANALSLFFFFLRTAGVERNVARPKKNGPLRTQICAASQAFVLSSQSLAQFVLIEIEYPETIVNVRGSVENEIHK